MAKSFFDEMAESFKRGWNFRFPSFSSGSSVRKGFRNPFVTETERERRETRKLYEEVGRAFETSPYANADAANDFMFNVVVEACARAEVTPTITLGEALFETVRGLLIAEGSIFGFPEVNLSAEQTLEEGVALRNYLNRKRRFLSDDVRLLDIWREKVIRIFEGIIGYLPTSVFSDPDAADQDSVTNTENSAVTLSAALIDVCDSPAEVIERMILTFFDDDVTNARLFDGVREQLDRNALVVSGIPPERREASGKSIVLPTSARGKSNAELVDAYLLGTPFADLFSSRFPFPIPFPVRFEHTVVVGGTGHGKTQLLQLLIEGDIRGTKEDGRSIIVMDSHGDLIRTVSHLAYFSQRAEQNLADRFVLIDPNDVEYPVSLNMFDWNRERLSGYRAVDREKILNGTIELYEYLFGALLGAELTQRQGVIFKYLARLMLEIPDATVHTLRELMENGEPFRPYMERLPPTARSFFQTRFFDRSFNETKKQILTRLWGVLSNATLERMFSSSRNKVNLFEAMGSGKVILINTAKDLLKQEGSAIFGRFFIALIAQATMERSILQPHERRPTFLYIDEAGDYFDENIKHLLNQARKYRVGMVLAHQNLDQLTPALRASVMASTSTKFAGGVSAKDASTFASEMRSGPEFIHGMRKRKDKTEFACFVRNLTPQAIRVSIPLGHVERLPTISDAEYEKLIEANRKRYATTLGEIERLQAEARTPQPVPAPRPVAPTPPQPKARREVEAAPQPPTAVEAESAETPPVAIQVPSSRAFERKTRPIPDSPALLGRGGRHHKYLQQIVKQAAEERGFRATIEETILDGAGRVDVSLSRGDRRIACEISVTTAREQELGNIEKCLAAGYEQVILVSSQERHLTTLRKFIVPALELDVAERVFFLMPEEVLAHLDGLAAEVEITEETIRGYKVKVTRQALSPEEAEARRQVIGRVIAKSVRQLKDKQ